MQDRCISRGLKPGGPHFIRHRKQSSSTSRRSRMPIPTSSESRPPVSSAVSTIARSRSGHPCVRIVGVTDRGDQPGYGVGVEGGGDVWTLSAAALSASGWLRGGPGHPGRNRAAKAQPLFDVMPCSPPGIGSVRSACAPTLLSAIRPRLVDNKRQLSESSGRSRPTSTTSAVSGPSAVAS